MRLNKHAFTLVELMIVVAIITVLALLLLQALSQAKDQAKLSICLHNLHQISLGTRLYATDNEDQLPVTLSFFLREPQQRYALSTSHPDRMLACPSDQFYYETEIRPSSPFLVSKRLYRQPLSHYSSYALNAGNLRTNPTTDRPGPGIAGLPLGAIMQPSQTALIAEVPAFLPYSWHKPKKLPPGTYQFSDAINLIAFADGHVQRVAIYWDRTLGAGLEAWQYDPPPNYSYRWSAK